MVGKRWRSFPFKLHENSTLRWCSSSIISPFLSLWNNLTSPLRIRCKFDFVSVTLLIRSCKLRLFDCSAYQIFAKKFSWILPEQQKKLTPFCRPALNWCAGESPLSIRILSLIGMPSDVSQFSLSNEMTSRRMSEYKSCWSFDGHLPFM